MTSWVRLWHDMPTDPKFRTIARVSRQPLASVVAVYCFMLTDASANASERGRTQANDETIASAFDLDDGAVSAIREAMQGRVLDGDKLAGWEKRQPAREDNSAERAKAWREAQKAKEEAERTRTQPNAAERPDTDSETDTERRKEVAHVAKASRVHAPIDEAVTLWNETADRAGFPKAQIVNERRRNAIRSRLAECGGLDGWKAALAKAEASSFCRGAGSSGWVIDLDALTQAKTFTKLMEGSYDDRSQSRPHSVHDQFKRAFERVDSYIDAMD
jgi:hypothetical protein